MPIREWQPHIGMAIYIRSQDLHTRSALALVEQLVAPDHLLVKLITAYREDVPGSDTPAIQAGAGERLTIPSYRAEEVHA